jgi:class 3 adenylate cyclase
MSIDIATGRTVVITIVFTDIIAFSKAANTRQMAMNTHLNAIVGEAVAEISNDDRVILDTGDGLAVALLGDPEDALFIAMKIRDGVARAEGDAAQTLRIGLHLGPVRIVRDLNNQPNVIGDGMNVAQRIMSFADPGEILVSRAYFEVVARLREGNNDLFRYLGVKHDKHVQEHQIYSLGKAASVAGDGGEVELAVRGIVTDQAATARLQAVDDQAPISAELLLVEEKRLTALIGPIAGLIVKNAAASADGVSAFYAAIARNIPDGPDRTAFLAGASAPEPGEVMAKATAPARAPEPSPTKFSPAAPAALAEADIGPVVAAAVAVLGPIGRMLVTRAQTQATTLDDLCMRVAAGIKNPAHRTLFLQRTIGVR